MFLIKIFAVLLILVIWMGDNNECNHEQLALRIMIWIMISNDTEWWPNPMERWFDGIYRYFRGRKWKNQVRIYPPWLSNSQMPGHRWACYWDRKEQAQPTLTYEETESHQAEQLGWKLLKIRMSMSLMDMTMKLPGVSWFWWSCWSGRALEQ